MYGVLCLLFLYVHENSDLKHFQEDLFFGVVEMSDSLIIVMVGAVSMGFGV